MNARSNARARRRRDAASVAASGQIDKPGQRAGTARPIVGEDPPADAQSAQPSLRPTKSPNMPDWRWRSFPVFAAFVAGVLVDSLINPASSDPALALRLLAIFGVCYAVVHVAITNVIVARRIRRYEQAQAAAGAPPDADQDDEEEWEDEVVYPGESDDR